MERKRDDAESRRLARRVAAADAGTCANLEPFFDGELKRQEATAFRAHLPGCAKCKANLMDLLHIGALAARLD